MHNPKICEVCGSGNLSAVINLGDHPLCDDLSKVGTGTVAKQYPIVINYCNVCKTGHQAYQVAQRTLFPDDYHYRARHTADVLSGMRDLVFSCKEHSSQLQGALILDVGCNDGSLLNIFREYGGKTIGVEPTGAAVDSLTSGHVVYREYFTQALAEQILTEHGMPDIITFTNVFAHIEDLPSLLKALQILLSAKTLLVIENHYLGAVLDKYQFDTFYHEHPRTYSLASFKYIAETLNAQIVSVEFPERYGGNIRVMIQKLPENCLSNLETAEVDAIEAGFEQRLLDMGGGIPYWIERKRTEINRLVALHGPLYGKAFPGRASILVKLLGLDEKQVCAVYEKPGSMKIGHYLPGTRIPILSDEAFKFRLNKSVPVLNFAWHISKEIHEYLTNIGCEAPIIDIFSVEEFETSIN